MFPRDYQTLCGFMLFSIGCAGAPLAQPAAPATGSGTPVIAGAGDCEARAFAAEEVQGKTARSTLMIGAGRGFGSGFLVLEGGEQLVVTNYHVVAGGGPLVATFTSPGGGMQMVPLEGLIASREHDLALLRASAEIGAPALVLGTSPARIGEQVAVVGYPGVSGSHPRLTFEPGAVTAAGRDLQGAELIQTNANINPGNSGGPMVDRCARVVGVVKGKHRTTERVGLVVPATAVAELLERYRAPRPEPKAAVERQLQALLTEVRFRRNDRAARFFGRAYVEKTGTSLLEGFSEGARRKAEALRRDFKRRGQDPARAAGADYLRALSKALTPIEAQALKLALAVAERRLDPAQAASELLAASAADQFGAIDDLWLDNAQTTESGCADAYVTTTAASGPRRFVLHLHQEWGEWMVQALKQVR